MTDKAPKLVRIKLTNPLQEPFSTTDQPELDKNGVIKGYSKFKKGDHLSVTPDTAEHLVMTGQAEVVAG